MCVFGVGPMFLGFYRVCRGWLFGNDRLILLQTEENYRDYYVHIFKSGVYLFLTLIYMEYLTTDFIWGGKPPSLTLAFDFR